MVRSSMLLASLLSSLLAWVLVGGCAAAKDDQALDRHCKTGTTGDVPCSCGQVPDSEHMVARCDLSSVPAMAGTTARCCRSFLTITVPKTPFLCACYAARCTSDGKSCGCERALGKSPDPAPPVDSCAAFLGANPTAVCCASGASCRCRPGLSCAPTEKMVTSCGPEATCDSAGDELVSACGGG
jgi:hypothetical protein